MRLSVYCDAVLPSGGFLVGARGSVPQRRGVPLPSRLLLLVGYPDALPPSR